jgi:hypothetical protein
MPERCATSISFSDLSSLPPICRRIRWCSDDAVLIPAVACRTIVARLESWLLITSLRRSLRAGESEAIP